MDIIELQTWASWIFASYLLEIGWQRRWLDEQVVFEIERWMQEVHERESQESLLHVAAFTLREI